MEKIDSFYVPSNLAAMTNDWNAGEQGGQPCGIEAMKDVFAWMPGQINGWYGWANDGKSTFFDFMSVVKAKRDKWKFCFMKQEDMTSRMVDGKMQLSSDDIVKNLIWMLTGTTPYKNFALKYHQKQISLDLLHEMKEFVDEHFFIIYPHDRKYNSVMDNFRFMFEKYGINVFLIDPFKSLILDDNSRTDFMMNEVFIAAKQFAMETNSVMNFITHPKSMTDVRINNKPDSAYKIVNQFMVAGGAAWDNNLDGQFSIYRPERHLDPNSGRTLFRNLKQRKQQLVGVRKGDCEGIQFDYIRNQFFFNGVCPIDGSMKPSPTTNNQGTSIFSESTAPTPPTSNDDTPF